MWVPDVSAVLPMLPPGHSIDDYMLGIGLGADALCSDIPVKVLEWKKKLDALK